MTREERIEQYTFIYIDKQPEETLSQAKKNVVSKAEVKKPRRPRSVLNVQPEQTNAGEAASSPSALQPFLSGSSSVQQAARNVWTQLRGLVTIKESNPVFSVCSSKENS